MIYSDEPAIRAAFLDRLAEEGAALRFASLGDGDYLGTRLNGGRENQE